MNILSLLVIIPLLTIIGILLLKDIQKTRLISAIGMGIQLIVSAVLVFMYLAERKAGNTDEMLFVKSFEWFKSLHIFCNTIPRRCNSRK